MLWAKWILPAKYPLKLRERVSVPCAGQKAAVGHGKTSLGPPQRGPGRAREQNAQGRFRGISQAAGGGRVFPPGGAGDRERGKRRILESPGPAGPAAGGHGAAARPFAGGHAARRPQDLPSPGAETADPDGGLPGDRLLCGLYGVYLTVDAARTAINNFVLEMFEGNALVWTEETSGSEGVTLPDNWDGPFDVMWVPERYTEVTSNSFPNSWMLYYDNELDDNDLYILAWSVSIAPILIWKKRKSLMKLRYRVAKQLCMPKRRKY